MTPDIKDIKHLRAQLTELCEENLPAVGYELVDLEYARDQHGWVVRVYIDHPPVGSATPPAGSTITHDDCERASRHLSTVLDVEDPITAAYRLEVSSPGVRRPLRKMHDFARFSGRQARVHLDAPLDGRRKFLGRLVSASDGVVVLDVDGAAVELPVERIQKAHLELEG